MLLIDTYYNNQTFPKIPKKLNSRILLSNINTNFCNYFDEIQIDHYISQIIYKYTGKIYDVLIVQTTHTHDEPYNIQYINFISYHNCDDFKILFTRFTEEIYDIYDNLSSINNYSDFTNFVCFVCNDIYIYKNNCIQIIVNTDFLLITDNFNNYLFLNFTPYTNIININGNTINIKYIKDKKMVYGYIKTNEYLNLVNVSMNNADVILKYKYDDPIIKILSYTNYKSNGDIIDICNKNGCLISTNYNYNTDTTNVISQCMINDNNTGLRYRGKYTSTSQNDKITNKTITINDNIVYDESNDGNVLVDKLERLVIKENDYIIGWKVAKSSNGDKRIIKLGIDSDATIIKPINEDIFINNGKERCNKAIVMDIQLYDDTEISVVPNETKAYSYVYNKSVLEYTVGQQIIPDSFCMDHNICCTNGIHYFPNRKSIFLSKY